MSEHSQQPRTNAESTQNREQQAPAKYVETSLQNFDADVDHRDRDSRVDRPKASEFGVGDRHEVQQSSERQQSILFSDTAENQQTLTGDDAAMRCLQRLTNT